MSEHLRILLVEDSKIDALLIQKALQENGKDDCDVTRAETLAAALRTLSEKEFDVILLDLSLPDTSEFNGLLSLHNMAPNLPVVILTAYADERMALKAVLHGAQDYLFKDKMQGVQIRRAMRYAVQRKQFESTLIMRANYDMLTGLANRILYENRLDMAIARYHRTEMGFGIFFLDLDGFKQVNDSMGHAAGDNLLRQVAERLKQSVRPYDTVARFGGDEFAIIIDGIEKTGDCETIAQEFIKKLSKPFIISDQPVTIGVSIGITTCLPGDHAMREAMIQHADEAMYGAKTMPESGYRFYGGEKTKPEA